MTEYKTNNDCTGQIQIADEVIAVIAGTAAIEVEGVVPATGMGMLGKKNFGKGVKVMITDNKAVIDINVNVKFGCKIQTVCEEIQKNVKNAVETMTGLDVQEVNVSVSGVEFEKAKSKREEEAAGDDL